MSIGLSSCFRIQTAADSWPLLESAGRQHLVDALFESSRHSRVELHFNKGLAGGTPDAIARARDTAMNPAVVSALAIAAASEQPVYPGIPGHEPSVDAGRQAAQRIERCMHELRAVAGETGSYVSESNYFERRWKQAYWGSNYARLADIKRKYDPNGLFVVHNGLGSERWSADGLTKLRPNVTPPPFGLPIPPLPPFRLPQLPNYQITQLPNSLS